MARLRSDCAYSDALSPWLCSNEATPYADAGRPGRSFYNAVEIDSTVNVRLHKAVCGKGDLERNSRSCMPATTNYSNTDESNIEQNFERHGLSHGPFFHAADGR
jgi:hypothetical protein